MKKRQIKPLAEGQKISDSQRSGELKTLADFSKPGLIGCTLRGFDITAFYQTHPELLRGFSQSKAQRDYRTFIQLLIESNLLELSQQPNNNSEQLLSLLVELKNHLTKVVAHTAFANCMHLYDELTVCVNALSECKDNSLIMTAILDILSAMMTKLYNAKKP